MLIISGLPRPISHTAIAVSFEKPCHKNTHCMRVTACFTAFMGWEAEEDEAIPICAWHPSGASRITLPVLR